jgi:hypothetical protein
MMISISWLRPIIGIATLRKMKKKECPSCAMEIDAGSKVCPVCSYEFPATNRGLKIVAFLLALMFLLWAIFL